jgi:hypothetical protein
MRKQQNGPANWMRPMHHSARWMIAPNADFIHYSFDDSLPTGTGGM